ncbi:MAG: hypothetical protein HXX16_19230 [Bacteroidales bacterium]|nr:hypothetical protein [Bacteroidales bacterium]
MANTINVKQCDNELIILAYQGSASFELCRILSGNYNSVNVNINIYPGQFQGTLLLDGINIGLNGNYNIALAPGIYSLIGLCVDWGGPQACAFSLNGVGVSMITTGASIGLFAYTAPVTLTV